MRFTRKRGLKDKTIRLVLLFYLVAIIVSIVVLLIILKGNRESEVERTLDSIAAQRQIAVEDYLHTVDELSFTSGYSNWMQTMFNPALRLTALQDARDNVTDFLAGMSASYYGTKFAFLMEDGTRLRGSHGVDYLDYSVDLKDKSWYKTLLEEGRYIEYGEDTGVYLKREEWSLTMYYKILNNSSLEQEGVLVITVPNTTFLQFLDPSYENAYTVLYDDAGYEVASTLPEDFENIDEYETTETEFTFRNTTWSLKVYLDKSTLVVNDKNVWMGYLLFVLFSAAFLAAATSAFTRYLTVPIIKCKEAMMEIRNNNIGINVENHYTDEIGELIEGFNEMSSSIYELVEKNKAISYLQKETEYQMLLQQIDPHFLYNTLELINGLMLNGETEQAVQMCEMLGQIFRYNLSRKKWVKVNDEVAYIKQYLKIMKFKIRMLSVYYEIEEGVLDDMILKSMLQPLVENSIRHGFSIQNKECCITISVITQETDIEISVMDNGGGIARDKLSELYRQMEQVRQNPIDRTESSLHVGIQNVFHRLYLEYEERMTFNIISKPGYGTRIVIILPKVRWEER